MTCPFNKDSLEKLETFIGICRTKPEIIHIPQLKFFKDYLTTLGAKLPPEPAMETESPAPSQENAEKESPEEPVSEEPVESEEESEPDLDTEGCITPDKVGDDQVMGDPDKVPSEEDSDRADEKRSEAQRQLGEGNIQEAINLFTEAIKLNPTSAVLFVKRGQCFLKLNKPNACIKDCTHALTLNPDSAAGYKFRGRAYRLIAEWESSARDLRQACRIDFDEQADEWLKEVTPNALKIEQHKLKVERKKADKEERERAERIRKAREAHEKAASENAGDPFAEMGGAGMGGPGMGGPGMGGAGMGEFYKLLQDPEIMAALQEPEVAQAFQDISMNPANFMKYQNNPKIMALVQKLTKLKGAGFGMGGGFGGAPKQPSAPAEDDGLD